MSPRTCAQQVRFECGKPRRKTGVRKLRKMQLASIRKAHAAKKAKMEDAKRAKKAGLVTVPKLDLIISYCCALNCESSSILSPNLSFFDFPKDSATRNEWIAATKRRKLIITKLTKLCSNHFDPIHLYTEEGETSPKLKPEAIPSIFTFRKSKATRRKLEETESELHEIGQTSTKKELTFLGVCCLCNNFANTTIDAMVIVNNEHMFVRDVISQLTGIQELDSMDLICLRCRKQVIGAFTMKMLITKKVSNQTRSIVEDTPSKMPSKYSPNESGENNSIYCPDCNIHFCVSEMGHHLVNCKMKLQTDNRFSHQRSLFLCSYCLSPINTLHQHTSNTVLG